MIGPSIKGYVIPYSPTGIADAQFSIGQYHFSQGSYEKALQYFRSAEAGGSAQACYQLGVMYYDGLGVPQGPVCELTISFQEVLKVFSLASEQSLLRLVLYIYCLGEGIPIHAKGCSSVGALHSCRCTVQHWQSLLPGIVYNTLLVAVYTIMYCQGYGVRQSDEEAERWWLRAGERKGVEEEEGGEGGSVVRAQNALAMFYSRKETLNLAKVTRPVKECEGGIFFYVCSHFIGIPVQLKMATWSQWVGESKHLT